jgi:hypothetical protein
MGASSIALLSFHLATIFRKLNRGENRPQKLGLKI